MTQPLPPQAVTVLAQRVFRMHHFLWHELRDQWSFYSDDTKGKIRKLGWEPPRPAIDEHNVEIVSNKSGEDFLYLHCELNGLGAATIGRYRAMSSSTVSGSVTLSVMRLIWQFTPCCRPLLSRCRPGFGLGMPRRRTGPDGPNMCPNSSRRRSPVSLVSHSPSLSGTPQSGCGWLRRPVPVSRPFRSGDWRRLGRRV